MEKNEKINVKLKHGIKEKPRKSKYFIQFFVFAFFANLIQLSVEKIFFMGK